MGQNERHLLGGLWHHCAAAHAAGFTRACLWALAKVGFWGWLKPPKLACPKSLSARQIKKSPKDCFWSKKVRFKVLSWVVTTVVTSTINFIINIRTDVCADVRHSQPLRAQNCFSQPLRAQIFFRAAWGRRFFFPSRMGPRNLFFRAVRDRTFHLQRTLITKFTVLLLLMLRRENKSINLKSCKKSDGFGMVWG